MSWSITFVWGKTYFILQMVTIKPILQKLKLKKAIATFKNIAKIIQLNTHSVFSTLTSQIRVIINIK